MFENATISHIDGGVNPLRDLETINTELLLADLATLKREKTRKTIKLEIKTAILWNY